MNTKPNAVSRSLLESLREFDTALLANTLDYVDRTPTHEFYMSGNIHSVTPGLGPTVGVAVTCRMDTSTPEGEPDTGLYWRQVEEMAAMDLPSVWVVEAEGSRPDHECILGDGMAKMLYSVGCTGAVTNGRVRDVAGLMMVPFGAYCRGTAVHHCALRMKAINDPISVGGIVVEPGDIVHASAEGVIKLPLACLERLVEAAPRQRAAEQEVHAIFRRTDLSITEKRKCVDELYRKNGFVRRG